MRQRVAWGVAALIVVAVWLAGGQLRAAGTSQANAAQKEERHVILVSIDGFAAFHLADAAVDLPNIRALAAAGTPAASSESVFPSVTHPSHTTLTTGVTPRRHGVVENTVTDRRTGRRFHITNLPRRESIRVPTLFDALHGAGLRTAAFFWPETKEDASIDDNVAEVFREAGGGPDPDAVTPGLLAVDIGATIVAVLILFRHRGNAARLWSRTERALPPSRKALGRTSGT